ncbi:MAG: GTPase ObgE, partial [Muribaculaceae bacterium]|nr:GTPase ObgE [Muribaculaceae bacterium]
ANDITAEYKILLNELEQFNPQLMDKRRRLAISKRDMLDDELMEEMARTLPDDIPHVFISAVTGQGLTELKDMLWGAINDENNRIEGPTPITHRPLDGHHRVREEDEFIFENVPAMPEDDEELEDFGEDYGSKMLDEDEYEWDEDIEPEDEEPEK